MTETKHIFGPAGHVGKIVGGTKYYYHSDHLGSLKQETDEQGNTVWSSPAQYEPFGELRSGGAQSEDGYFYTGKLRDNSTGLYYYGARYYDAKVGRFITKDSYTFLPDDERLINIKNSLITVENINWWITNVIFSLYNPIRQRDLMIPSTVLLKTKILQTWLQTPQEKNSYIYTKNNPLKNLDLSGHAPTPEGLGGGLRSVTNPEPPGGSMGGELSIIMLECIRDNILCNELDLCDYSKSDCAVSQDVYKDLMDQLEQSEQKQDEITNPICPNRPMDAPLPIKGSNKPIPI